MPVSVPPAASASVSVWLVASNSDAGVLLAVAARRRRRCRGRAGRCACGPRPRWRGRRGPRPRRRRGCRRDRCPCGADRCPPRPRSRCRARRGRSPPRRRRRGPGRSRPARLRAARHSPQFVSPSRSGSADAARPALRPVLRERVGGACVGALGREGRREPDRRARRGQHDEREQRAAANDPGHAGSSVRVVPSVVRRPVHRPGGGVLDAAARPWTKKGAPMAPLSVPPLPWVPAAQLDLPPDLAVGRELEVGLLDQHAPTASTSGSQGETSSRSPCRPP